MREARLRIVNVGVTQGSNRERQQPRWQELKNACDRLGFEVEPTAPNGLEKINIETRTGNAQRGSDSVKVIAAMLLRHQPKVIFFPHEQEWNSTHIGTHFLVRDALKTMSANFHFL